MAMRPWNPPSWAELDDGEDGRSDDIDYFMDDVARVAGVASRDDLYATFAHIPTAIGGEGNSVMQLFLLDSEQVFQELLGMVVYHAAGSRNYFIRK